jgi:heme/copper-type cytochrome/quinol oxidase subunit 3
MDRNKLGVLVFISSEAIFFATLIITYIVYRGIGGGPSARDVLDVPVTGVFTVFLLSSSLTMARVSARLRQGDAGGVRRWLLATILLGAVFLVGQGYEYVHLYLDNVTISRNLWGSTFFTLTGFHGLHVLVGLISMAILVAVVGEGRTSPPLASAAGEGEHRSGVGEVERAGSAGEEDRVRGESAVEAISYYWHFVDAVWVVIFPVVYLWTLLS